MASSIHIEAVKTSSFLHNDRTMKVSYLIDDSSKNYCSVDSKTALENFNHYKEIATKKYQELTKQKLQSKTIFLKEAIINLEAHHTQKDLEPIINKLESYGFKILQAAIHRDEGFKNKETNQKQYNYHAHITMFNLDLQTGKSVKFGKNYRTELSKLQTFVANALNMERGKISDKTHAIELGKEYNPNQTRRLGTHQYKRAMKEQEEKRIEQKQELQNTKLFTQVALAETKYLHKEYQAKITALENVENSLKKELHGLNNEIAKIKSDDELKSKKIEELESKIQKLTNLNQELKTQTAKNEVEVVEYVKTLKFELERTKELKAENDTLKSDLSVLKQDMSVLEMDLRINQEDFSLLLKQNREIEKKLETQEKNKKTLLKKYEAPQNANFWAFVQEKFTEFTQKIKELTQKIKELTHLNQELKTQNEELNLSSRVLQTEIKELQRPKTLEEQAVRLIKDYKLEDKITDPQFKKVVELIEKSESQKNPNFYVHSTLCQVVQKIEEKEQSQSVYQSR